MLLPMRSAPKQFSAAGADEVFVPTSDRFLEGCGRPGILCFPGGQFAAATHAARGASFQPELMKNECERFRNAQCRRKPQGRDGMVAHNSSFHQQACRSSERLPRAFWPVATIQNRRCSVPKTLRNPEPRSQRARPPRPESAEEVNVVFVGCRMAGFEAFGREFASDPGERSRR